MSNFEFKLPDIGEGVTEGEIVAWLVSPGDIVVEDQPIVEVMTDKATVTITAPKAGKVLETRAPVGGIVAVHSVLIVFDVSTGLDGAASGPKPAGLDGAASGPKPPLRTPAAAEDVGLAGAGSRVSAPLRTPAAAEDVHSGGGVDLSTGIAANVPGAKKDDGPAATAVGDIKEDLPGMSLMSSRAQPAASHAASPAAAVAYYNPKPLATPATRKLARDKGVDLRSVPPTGPKGRVTKDDVHASAQPRAVARAPQAPGASAPQPSAPTQAIVAAPAASHAPAQVVQAAQRAPYAVVPSYGAGQDDERIPLRGVRKRIFEGMSRSVHTAAHFTFVEECDAGALKDLRARLKPSADKQGVKLTFLPFFVKACVAALKKHPILNSAFDESTQEVVVRKRYHIGIASSTEQGLIVPVVRDADTKSILEIARDITRLSDDARAGKSKKEDISGSTFTITSLGTQGGLFATPILNFPEVAILGIHQMKQKPVVRDGRIVIGDVMLLSLSFDHRIIDGHVGAAFAYDLIELLQDPDRLFLEMS